MSNNTTIDWREKLEDACDGYGDFIPWHRIHKATETEIIKRLIEDARHTFRYEADSFEEGEQQLKVKWLGRDV